MPSRLIREGILTSDRVNELSMGAEVFYRRLMSVVDDYGRFDGRENVLRVSCFPLRVDSVSEKDINQWIADCVSSQLVLIYVVDGKRFLEIQDFKQQVRAKSRFPAPSDGQVLDDPPALAKQVRSRPQATVHLVGVGVGVGVGVECSSEPRPGSKPPPVPSGLQIPLNDLSEFDVPQADVDEWETAYPAVDVRQQLRQMRAWSIANPNRKKTRRGISAFIVRWLSKAQDLPGHALPASVAEQINRV